MKHLLVLRKTKPLQFYRKLLFDFCKSLLVLLVRKPFDGNVFCKSFISFLETLSETQKSSGRNKTCSCFYIWYFNSMKWIELKHSLEVFCKKRCFLKKCKLYRKTPVLQVWRRICECDLLWECMTSRSSRPEVFCKKGVLRNFVKFTGKHLCQGLFF